ncbi:MAG: MBOAT family protein [bacterium]|nr:MBOAT family protein [bacterium]
MLPGFGTFILRLCFCFLYLSACCFLTYIIVFKTSNKKLRNFLLGINWLPLLALPLVIPFDYRLFRLMIVLGGGFHIVRSLDFMSARPPFPGKPPFHKFFFYTFFALSLKYPAPAGQDPPRDWSGVFQIIRGGLMSAFVVLLMTANTCLNTPELSFWLNLFCKMAEWYLLFVGFMDFYYGVGKLVRIEGRVNLVEPILSRSPADFWFNRWNLPIIEYLQKYVFLPLNALNHPYRATFLTFLISGLLHEYGFDIAIGGVKGYVLAFFMIQGISVMAIRAVKRPVRRRLPGLYRFWWKSRPAEAVQVAANLAFFVLTGTLFFKAVDLVIDFHRIGFIMDICNRL